MLAIDAAGLSFEYSADGVPVRVLDDVSLKAAPGEIICIWGPSGGGKSTFLRLLGGMEKPARTSGAHLKFFGKDCDLENPSPLDEARDDTGFVFQNCALISNMDIMNNLLLPLKFRRDKVRSMRKIHRSWALTPGIGGLRGDLYGDEELREKALRAMQNMLVDDLRSKFPHEISLGMQKRVAVARAMVLNPKILLLDEPTSGLDALSRRNILALISNLNELRKVTVVLVTHDLDIPRRLGAKISVLHDRRLTEPRTFAELRKLDDPFVRELLENAENGETETRDGEMLDDGRIFEELTRSGGAGGE